MRYTVLIDGKAGAYGVVVPDLPGCHAMGKTIQGALDNAQRAMRDWIEITEEEGERCLRHAASRGCVATRRSLRHSPRGQCSPVYRSSARAGNR